MDLTPRLIGAALGVVGTLTVSVVVGWAIERLNPDDAEEE